MSISKLGERRLQRGKDREEKSKHVIETIRAYAEEKEFPELATMVESAVSIAAACAEREDGDEIMRKVAGEIANLFLSHFGGGIMEALKAISVIRIKDAQDLVDENLPKNP